MQLRYDQLETQLKKELSPAYLVSGDVPFLVQEARTLIQQTAFKKGFTDKQIFQVETGFSWQKFLTDTSNFSLFGDKQFIELRVINQLGEGGAKALQSYLASPPSNKILLITMGKLDAAQQKTAWIQSILKHGSFIQIWPLTLEQLPSWITKRLALAGLKADQSGIDLLAANAEGNLLAAAQEIEKLSLLVKHDSEKSTDLTLVSTDEIKQAISDNARFDIFQLADSGLQGDRKRALRILIGLRGEGIEPPLILWALTREIRVLIQMAYTIEAGQSIEQAFAQYHVWEKRKPILRAALQKHRSKNLLLLLQQASKIDLIIKGLEKGQVWNELERLLLRMTKNI